VGAVCSDDNDCNLGNRSFFSSRVTERCLVGTCLNYICHGCFGTHLSSYLRRPIWPPGDHCNDSLSCLGYLQCGTDGLCGVKGRSPFEELRHVLHIRPFATKDRVVSVTNPRMVGCRMVLLVEKIVFVRAVSFVIYGFGLARELDGLILC
jgi:hypothetical protein